MELVAETKDGETPGQAASAGDGGPQRKNALQLVPFLDLVQLHVPAAEDPLPGKGELRRSLNE